MKHSMVTYVTAITSSIAMILLAVLLGIVIGFMAETRHQTVTVDTFDTGDISWICLVTRSGNRIDDMSCERLENWQG